MKKRGAALLLFGIAVLMLEGCKTLEAINLESPPARTVYGQGQDLDLTGLWVNGIYEDDSTKKITILPSHVSGYDKHRTGEQTIIIAYRGKIARFTVTVLPLTGLSVMSPPAKVLYRQGEDFDPQGLVVMAEWEQIGTGQIALDDVTISGFNKSQVGVQAITVAAEGKRTAFNVEVQAMTSIAVTQQPTKTRYKTGEDLDLSGMVITGTWDGIGSSRVNVTAANVTGYDKTRIGSQTLTVTLEGKTATFPVSVAGLTAMRITAFPDKDDYVLGEALDLQGLMVTGTYTDHITASEEPVPETALAVSGYDRNKLGKQVVTITANGISATFPVTVSAAPAGGTVAVTGTTSGGTTTATTTAATGTATTATTGTTSTTTAAASGLRQALLAEAEKYIGAVPYVSPPNIPNSFDCSGFVNYIYTKAASMPLATSTSAYAGIGRQINFSDAKPGDVLVFVSQAGGSKLDHVAMLYKKSDSGELRGSWIIHAVSIPVQSATIQGNASSPGIVISELGKRGDGVWQNEYFIQRFLYVKRFIED